ncbi:MAG: DUF4271 domain-containing protein [Cyclobacteriaceae bacterium]|nr:DUF4271 domain-containing protein [Cyclobacteriaceae bacterium]MCB0499176.1 DUF4271 domain-containing protein [Cyclobacteriaceae bacterium]MCB9237984.1 DUF4271 domain-containing protein [Flammeovirgaceae bacterium]MCO5271866.1 DUF4271 domain-containing protein [Cyclobacteriaceae bacterium]MCW5901692.1 DUF4271 domain-containing protein [Cyclobacteriaceae bacterium]
MRGFLFLLLFYNSLAIGHAQPVVGHPVVVDLRQDWKVFSGGAYEAYRPDAHGRDQAIYIEVDPGRYDKGSRFMVKGARPFSVYLNFRQVASGIKHMSLDMDSLRAKMPSPWWFAIYHERGLSWLTTEVVSPPEMRKDIANTVRASGHYLDFSIIASLLLLVFFAALLQTNPRHTFDYLNAVRLFSIQERDDALLNSRISASVNILYYTFCSLAAGLALLTIFHFGADLIPVSKSFVASSFGECVWQWLKVSGLALTVLMAKLLVLMGLSRLFDFREAPALQFHNFVRLVFFISILSGGACLCYFIFKIQNPQAYSFLLGAIIFLLALWPVVIGLKLLRRSPFRFFHLFSYLCASELIPIIILIKVLNS